MSNLVCPHCQFQRQPTDSGPSWQCPNCGKAYRNSSAQNKHTRPVVDNSAFHSWQKRLNFWLLISILIAATAFYQKNQLPDISEIDQSLIEEPQQSKTRKQPFSFYYLSRLYNVNPIAKYEIQGLVVSHNDTTNAGNNSQDETALNKKDLCVIWGENVKTSDYLQATFSSGTWSCHSDQSQGSSLIRHQVSNNHLITDSGITRKQIENVKIGDQVRLKGWLVNYKDEQNNFWRNSSTIRNDLGKDSSEVIFVNQLEVISQNNPRWHSTWQYGLIALIAILILKTIVLIIEVSPHRY